jgi:signal transduction histidine kinase
MIKVRETAGCKSGIIGCKSGTFAGAWSTILVMDAGRQSAPRSLPGWQWIAVIWGGIGLFDATQNVFVMRAEGMHHAWLRLFFTLFFSWVPFALATPAVFRLARRFPAAQWKRASTWAVHLSAAVTLGIVHAGWIALWERTLNPWMLDPVPTAFPDLWLHKFLNGLLSYVILYGLILLVAHIQESREKLAFQHTETARLNERLSKAQLSALRRQIEPHFLFNTLNAIAGLVREGKNDAAVNMIAGLSEFLRRVVADSDRQQVPLAEELEFAQKYLDIQKARFAERLQFSIDVPPELLSAQVPSLILQPMVENAVKHGIAQRVSGGAIRIAATRSNGTLRLSVYNDGPGLPAGWETTRSGIGIVNTRTRLQSLYGKHFDLTLRSQEPDGVEAAVSVPYTSADNVGTS